MTNKNDVAATRAAIWGACLSGREVASGVDGELRLADGTTLSLTFMTPTGVTPVVPEDVEYVLVGGPCWTMWLGGTVDELAERLARADDLKREWAEDARRLRDIYDRAVRDGTPTRSDEFELYSDFHKDVFGYRPRGWQYDPLGNAA